MSGEFPYSYIACPCSGADHDQPPNPSAAKESPENSKTIALDTDEEGKTFDPRSSRSNFSLYPLENLLYCEDCHEIKCQRCVLEEIVCWFCPGCLFEVGGSSIRSEGNRCTRNCCLCPNCMSPLYASDLMNGEGTAQDASIILNCPHCNWTSLEVGIRFERPGGIYYALSRMKEGGGFRQTRRELERELDRRKREEERGDQFSTSRTVQDIEKDLEQHTPDLDELFINMRTFYSSHSAEISSNASYDVPGGLSYGSPGGLNRLMGLYHGSGYTARKDTSKPIVAREAYGVNEGVRIVENDTSTIEKLQNAGWKGTISSEQRKHQNRDCRFTSDMRPIPVTLRSRRSKRCRTCRHILVKPDSKVQSTRFRIKLVASNYIPSIKLSLLQPGSSNLDSLAPMKAFHMVLTLRNPLFDPVRVTLATPTRTPGRFQSKVTILCPQFDIGQNTDVWDEALSTTDGKEKRRTRTEIAEGQAEAGKVWEKGRNWTSVVLEVVPAILNSQPLGLSMSKKDTEIAEDEDVLEIPVFVRVEYETEANAEDESGSAISKVETPKKEKRELAYWIVLGIGRLSAASM